MKLRFPAPFKHKHPPVRNVNEIFREQLTFGQIASDWVARVVGSWSFILVQSFILAVWVVLNVIAITRHWDPYPFILMNLLLSLQAAYAAPIIMMSQNRQAAMDRVEAHNNYLINMEAEEEIHAVLENLSAQNQALASIQQTILELLANKGNEVTVPSPNRTT
jgi:uncharacterized membrane protein